MRIKFTEKNGQKSFFAEVLTSAACPSLHELINRGINVKYSSLKNYSSGRRFLSKELFELLCTLAEIDKKKFKIEEFPDVWGQSKGGKISKRK